MTSPTTPWLLLLGGVPSGFYQNSFYKWTFQGDFADSTALVAKNGSVCHLEQDNGLTGQEAFSMEKDATASAWLDWMRHLQSTGVVDGIFLDKPQIGPAYDKARDEFVICEFGGSNSGKHPFDVACCPITSAQNATYSSNKEAMLATNMKLWRGSGGYVLSYKGYSSMLYLGWKKSSAKQLIRDVNTALADPAVDYVYLNAQDQGSSWNASDITPVCSESDVALGLMAAQTGTFFGCNGWADFFGYPLGEPLGNATVSGSTYTRKFGSGTVATFDDKTHKGSIKWASTEQIQW